MTGPWEAFRAEYEAERIGPQILTEVRSAIRSVIPRYDPVTYGWVSRWEEGIDDLVQSFVVDVLIGEGQLDWMMAHCRDAEHFRHLLVRDIRRLMARRRTRTVIDTLLDRCKPILLKSPFAATHVGRRVLYGLESRQSALREPSELELHRAAAAAALIPRRLPERGDRAPSVYSDQGLAAVIQAIAGTLPCHFSIRDLDWIFRFVLTGWLPGFLIELGGTAEPSASEFQPEQIEIVRETVDRILDNLADDQKSLLYLKLGGVSDGRIAEQLGVSRPTVAKRKGEIWASLLQELEDLDPVLQEAALAGLDERLGPDGD